MLGGVLPFAPTMYPPIDFIVLVLRKYWHSNGILWYYTFFYKHYETSLHNYAGFCYALETAKGALHRILQLP